MKIQKQYTVTVWWVEEYSQDHNIVATSKTAAVEELMRRVRDEDGIDLCKGYDGHRGYCYKARLVGGKARYLCRLAATYGSKPARVEVEVESFPEDIVTDAWTAARKIVGEDWYGQFMTSTLVRS